MTVPAVFAELATMHILLGMAAKTIRCKARGGYIFSHVAVIATGFRMLACQRKLRLQPMVECNPGPAVGRMTGFATRREAARMHVITAVAVRASDASVLESRRGVAGFTGNCHMQSAEREIRKPVVEDYILAP